MFINLILRTKREKSHKGLKKYPNLDFMIMPLKKKKNAAKIVEGSFFL